MAEYEYQCEKCSYCLVVKMSMKDYSSKLKYDCPNCGTNMSPVRSEDHPDYEPQEDKENKHE